jgi:LmbE family N-acetylglucosaminyl deacetylase
MTVLGTALFIAAHPDDENTAMLNWLEHERLVRTAYLSMTRGDGGQNLIGEEKGDLLGLIRTQELLAARRIDGAEQFFTRAVDFGYSKNPDETLSIWGRDSVLADMVRVIRTFRPDVLISRFPSDGAGGHGHHTASAILAEEAFEAAGDPTRFPDQLATLSPWKPVRLFWNRFSWGGAPKPEDVAGMIPVDIGSYNPLLAKSYTELAADSRSMHKSQGFGSAERRGTALNHLKLLAGSPASTDPFEGIDLSWSRVPGGAAVGAILDRAWKSFDSRNPAASLPTLLEAHAALEKLRATPAGAEAAVLLDHKSVELQEVIRGCAGLWLEAIASRPTLSPGDSIHISATAVNRSPHPFQLLRAEIVGRAASAAAAVLENNTPVSASLKFVVPREIDFNRTQPYWLREAGAPGLFRVAEPALVGTPENEPVFEVLFTIESAGNTLRYRTPVIYRWTDRVEGEQHRPVAIVPPVTLSLADRVTLFPDRAPRDVRVDVTGRGAAKGAVRLRLPAGWRSTPESAPLSIDGTPRSVTFSVTPPAEPASATLLAEFVRDDGEVFDRSLVEINYPHIPIQTLFPEAEARIVRLDVKRRGERVGYIMGPGDEVPGNLRQAGYTVTLLSDADIESGDLSVYDAIVIGVRAYNTRDRLKARHDRILDYVENGGTVVVQYNTVDNTLMPDLGPYPLKLGRERVTVEGAPVLFVDPADPLLNVPNPITPADFEGWVQERGLYFASEWDSAYTPVLVSQDPGEKEARGGLLSARYGKGIFIYTGYAFFRQLPAGVPGAYRLFVNLVSAR